MNFDICNQINRINISITNRCNLSCDYCNFRKKQSSEDSSFEEIRLILDNIISYLRDNSMKRFTIGLVGSGEPLLSFDTIKKVVEYVRPYSNISLYTITNGILFDNSVADYFFINKERIQVNISCDGPKEVHDYGRKTEAGRGSFDEMYDALNRYQDRFGRMPIVNCTVHKKTIEKNADVIEFFKENRIEEISFSKYIEKEKKYWISGIEFVRFLEEARASGFTMRQYRQEQTYDCISYGTHCGVGKNNLYYANGAIYPCARFSGIQKYILGNYETPLNKVIEEMKKQKHTNACLCYYDIQVS